MSEASEVIGSRVMIRRSSRIFDLTMVLVRSHELSNIPDKKTLIPGGRGTPALCSKQAPINTRDELCVKIHLSKLSSKTRDTSMRLRGRLNANSATVGPDSCTHIVAATEQDITEVGAPSNLTNGMYMSIQSSDWSISNIANIEYTDYAINTCCGYNCISVFIPVMGQDLVWIAESPWLPCYTRSWWRTVNRNEVH
jgi:hypothetical protein